MAGEESVLGQPAARVLRAHDRGDSLSFFSSPGGTIAVIPFLFFRPPGVLPPMFFDQQIPMFFDQQMRYVFRSAISNYDALGFDQT
jgi:hypothetical protein